MAVGRPKPPNGRQYSATGIRLNARRSETETRIGGGGRRAAPALGGAGRPCEPPARRRRDAGHVRQRHGRHAGQRRLVPRDVRARPRIDVHPLARRHLDRDQPCRREVAGVRSFGADRPAHGGVLEPAGAASVSHLPQARQDSRYGQRHFQCHHQAGREPRVGVPQRRRGRTGPRALRHRPLARHHRPAGGRQCRAQGRGRLSRLGRTRRLRYLPRQRRRAVSHGQPSPSQDARLWVRGGIAPTQCSKGRVRRSQRPRSPDQPLGDHRPHRRIGNDVEKKGRRPYRRAVERPRGTRRDGPPRVLRDVREGRERTAYARRATPPSAEDGVGGTAHGGDGARLQQPAHGDSGQRQPHRGLAPRRRARHEGRPRRVGGGGATRYRNDQTPAELQPSRPHLTTAYRHRPDRGRPDEHAGTLASGNHGDPAGV